jgi:hypothetical protein
MQWSMPHRVLQVVAGLIGLIAVSAFTLGVINAPNRGRLPGEKTQSDMPGAVAPVEATEAAPLSQERIEGPAPAPELTPEEKAQQEAAKLAKAQPDLTAKVPAASQPSAPPPPPPPTPTLQTSEPGAPPAEEAPH